MFAPRPTKAVKSPEVFLICYELERQKPWATKLGRLEQEVKKCSTLCKLVTVWRVSKMSMGTSWAIRETRVNTDI